ncbi:hypothetical protein [Bartonella koehlerae]|nr:hypothetical protein [Bartonella koehlerae]
MEATQPPKFAFKAYERALEYYPQMQKLKKHFNVLLDEQSPQVHLLP